MGVDYRFLLATFWNTTAYTSLGGPALQTIGWSMPVLEYSGKQSIDHGICGMPKGARLAGWGKGLIPHKPIVTS